MNNSTNNGIETCRDNRMEEGMMKGHPMIRYYKQMYLSVLMMTTLLVTPMVHASIVATTENSLVRDNEQCGENYQSIVNQPLLKSDTPITHDQQQAEATLRLTQFADEYLLRHDIAEFDAHDEVNNNYDQDQLRQAIFQGKLMSQELATFVFHELFAAYVTGKYVPKDEAKAVLYLRKLVDFYEHTNHEHVEMTLLRTLVPILDLMHEKGAIRKPADSLDEEMALFSMQSQQIDEVSNRLGKLFIEAGSRDIEASVMIREMSVMHDACDDILLPKIKVLAEEGSRSAIHFLADYYSRLNDKNPSSYIEPMRYWQQQAERYPLGEIRWGS